MSRLFWFNDEAWTTIDLLLWTSRARDGSMARHRRYPASAENRLSGAGLAEYGPATTIYSRVTALI